MRRFLAPWGTWRRTMPLSARTGTPATIRVGRAVYDKKSMLCLGRIVKGREQQWPEKLNQRKTKPPVPVGWSTHRCLRLPGHTNQRSRSLLRTLGILQQVRRLRTTRIPGLHTVCLWAKQTALADRPPQWTKCCGALRWFPRQIPSGHVAIRIIRST